MIRASEAVLPGHPDKLCDFVAESVVQAALALDAEAYAQIEAGLWCDQLWLSGGYAARGAAQQLRAESPLEVRHLARHRGLREAEAPRGLAHPARLDHLGEDQHARGVPDPEIVAHWQR